MKPVIWITLGWLSLVAIAKAESNIQLISDSKAEAVCKEIVQLANTGKIKSRLLKFSNPSHADGEEWQKGTPDDFSSRLIGTRDVDYGHDGKPRRLGLVISGGSCAGTGITDLGKSDNSTLGFSSDEIEDDDNLRWAGWGRNQYFLFVQGEAIVIDASFSGSNYDLALASWFREGAQRPLCAFSALGKVKVKIKENKIPQLCTAVAAGTEDVSTIDKNSEQEIAEIREHLSLNSAQVFTVDLNATGKQNKLFLFDYSSGGGCGGDQQNLQFLKPSESKGPVDPLEKLLQSFSGPLTRYSKDWKYIRILSFDAKPFLLAKGPDDTVGVYSLWKNNIERWCTFNLIEQFKIKKMYLPKR
jgi:DNA-binding TFAR19-related protein (PDSD5 family)